MTTGRVEQPVAVLELDPTGHRLEYLRHIVDAVGADRCLVLTSVTAVASEEFTVHAPPARRIELVDTGSCAEALDGALRAASAGGAERLVVLDGDRYVPALLRRVLRGPRLPVEVRVLLMRTTEIGGPEPLRPATIVKPVLVHLSRLSRRVRMAFLTDAWGVVGRRRGYRGVPGVRDPIADPVVATGRPGWFPVDTDDEALIGVFGVVEERKNIPLLLEALEVCPRSVLVVGGRVAPPVREQLRTERARSLERAGRLVVEDRMLGADELSAALTHVDAVAVLHDNDTPSGILAQACARGTPALVAAGGWLERVVDATGAGVAVTLDADAVAEGMLRLADEPDHFAAAAWRHARVLGTSSFTDGLTRA